MYFKISFWFLTFIYALSCAQTFTINHDQLPEIHGDKFLYFGYGSNMLTKRIHIQNPTAVKIGMGMLKDYRLDFNTHTERWNGAPATIVPTENATVYGTLWDINLSNLDDLDDQEGVYEDIYFPASVPIHLSNDTVVIARAYLLVEQPATELNALKSVPLERRPSKTYLQCLVKGAQESGIPLSYVQWLQSIKHNGYVVADLEQLLQLGDVELHY